MARPSGAPSHLYWESTFQFHTLYSSLGKGATLFPWQPQHSPQRPGLQEPYSSTELPKLSEHILSPRDTQQLMLLAALLDLENSLALEVGTHI